MFRKLIQNTGWRSLHDKDKKVAIVLFAGMILMTVHIYEGNEKFFLKHFANGMQDGPLLDWYKYIYKHLASLLLFFLVPAFLIRLIHKEKLIDYGLSFGNWKSGLPVTLLACIILTPIAWVSSRNPEFREFYPLTTLANQSLWYFFLWGLTYLPHYIGWEFLFRGYIGFGIKERLGFYPAILIPTAFTTLLHIGKPEGETWSTIIAGIFLSLLTFRTGSIFWAVAFHWYAGMINTLFAGMP